MRHLSGLAGLAAAVVLVGGCSSQRPTDVSGVRVQLADGRMVPGDEVTQPLVASAVPILRGNRRVDFQFQIVDADGRPIRAVYLGRSLMPAPRLEVYDDSGAVIHAADMEYG